MVGSKQVAGSSPALPTVLGKGIRMKIHGLSRVAACIAVFGFVIACGICCAQNAAPTGQRVGVPWDWSHQKVFFSQPTDPAMQALVEQDPRYWHQQLHRGQMFTDARLAGGRDARSLAALKSGDGYAQAQAALLARIPESMRMRMSPANYPASAGARLPWKKSLWLMVAGVAGFALAGAWSRRRRWMLLGLSGIMIGLLLVITNCGGGGGNNSGMSDQPGRDWSESVGTSSYTQTQPAYPAKYQFYPTDPTPSCAGDYIVYTLAASNPGHLFNIVGFNNLYVNTAGTGFCSGTSPNAIFAYSASQNNGTLSTAPVPSEDGTQIAFVEDTSSSQFHVLKWQSGNVSASAFPTPYNTSNMTNCATNGGVAPCEYSLVYSSHNATFSSPYIDFISDTAYVTDDQGQIAAISPVFKATPTNPPAKVWSLTTAAATNMTPATYDNVSGNVFVADHNGLLYYVRTKSTSSGTCASGTPPCFGLTMTGGASLDVANNKTVWEPPMVDSVSQTVFVFTNNPPKSSGLSGSTIVQTTTTLSTEVVASIGAGTGNNIFSGTFDNNYLTSPASGRIYACGGSGGNLAELYAFGFTGVTMNTAAVSGSPLQLSNTATNCSPLTEVYNQSAGEDLLFGGIATACNQLTGGPTGGCIASFIVGTGSMEIFPTGAATTPVAEAMGTTGIVIDDEQNGSSGGNSSTNLYFVTQGTQSCFDYHGNNESGGNCAVKLTQVGLQ
ncbi:MAG: hypothetical protein WAL41_01235 [Mycobacterium sp.]